MRRAFCASGPRGSFLDEVQPSATRAATLAVFTHASKVIRPVYTIAELQDPAGRPVQTERLLLPFALDKGLRFLSTLETFSPEGAFVRRGLLTAPPAPVVAPPAPAPVVAPPPAPEPPLADSDDDVDSDDDSDSDDENNDDERERDDQ